MKKLINLEGANCRSQKYTDGLINLINDLNLNYDIQNMVEIGSYQGESTVIFAQNFKNLNKLFAVDPWMNGYAPGDVCSDTYPMNMVESNFDIRISEHPIIIKKKMKSSDFIKEVDDYSMDFVYIDGDHSYNSCKQDILMWLPKIKKNGIIAGHDYLSSCFLGVVTAVDEIFGSPDKIYEDTSWIKKL